MSNMYSIARQLQAPGVQTVATFNPTRLGKTLRNMTRKSIASGIHIGGWSSKTRSVRDLIFKLAGYRPSVYVTQYADYMSFTTPRPITANTMSEMIGLLEADCSLQKMGYDEIAETRYKPTRSELYATIDNRHDHSIAKLKFVEQGKANNLIVRNAKLRQQIAEVFLRERTVAEIELAECLASLLDKDCEYNIPTDHAF